jgi:hypothetical protein
MYVIGSIIYALVPTTCTPEQFIDGTYATLPSNAPFREAIVNLASNPANI